MSDHDLLRRYARTGDQAAFAELVTRHLNLVYSAARRQVRPPQLAEDVTQSVFLDLARRARDFPSGQPLAPWLHVVTRRTAIDALRRESRRHAREQTAQEIAAMQTPESPWSHIEPLLDEAVAALPTVDRTAIVLRFFENKSLREIGTALGTNEDAAQKRVSRALDQLRTRLLRRGLTVTAAGLATDLSAHAILTAPVTLGASISAAAALSVASGAALAGAQAVAMTTLQKSLLAAALTLGLGTGLYEATIYARQNSDLTALTQRESDLAAQLRTTRTQQAAFTARLKSVEAQIDARLAAASRSAGDDALVAQMRMWLSNTDQLRNLLTQRPEFGIPELALVGPEVWSDAAAGADLSNDREIRRALAKVRLRAENLFANKIQGALRAYLRVHDDNLPSHLNELLPHFDPPLDPTWLDRYTLQATGKYRETAAKGRFKMDIVGVKQLVDVEFDKVIQISPVGFAVYGAMDQNVQAARRAFIIAHPNERPITAAQYLPYLKWPVSEAVLHVYLTPPAGVPPQ